MKEYKRLTQWNKQIKEWDFADGVTDSVDEYYQKIGARLCELEDKIEQGTLIELPCKVGDTVYFVDKQNKIIEEFDVISIAVSLTPYSDGKTNRIEIAEKGTGKRNFDYILFFGWIGNSVFFTREEAEARLKELEGGGQ